MKALQGIRVLDATRLLPGALATQQLADFGAEVIKIEQPGLGDYARTLLESGSSAIFAATNRGKRSVVLDLKSTAGKNAFLCLIRCADVLIEGFRPGVMDRLGLGFETLQAENSGLIYVSLTGYGQSGPMRAAAGHDLNYLAVSGVLDQMRGDDGDCIVPGIQIADIAGGAMQAVIGILLALTARQQNGEGQLVDISMTRGAAQMLTVRGHRMLSGAYACYTTYQCRDGRSIAVGALEPKFWTALCRALGREDLIARQFEPETQQPALKHELAAMFGTKDAAEWAAELSAHDCCVTVVRTLAEAVGTDWLRVDEPWPALSATQGQRATSVPLLGENTREVLMEAGLSEAEIAGL